MRRAVALGLAAAAAFIATRAASAADRPRGVCGLEGRVLPACPARPPRALGPQPRRLVYLNGDGGAYQPATTTDSSRNRASVIGAAGTIPPFGGNDLAWQQLVGCVKGHFERWNVEIVETDPGDTPHIEAVVGGTPEDVGLSDPSGGTLLGIASIEGFCSVTERSISFSFEQNHFTITELCLTVVHEIGHSLGLEHAFHCPEVMSYLVGCGVPKTFQDALTPCGEYDPRDCICEMTQQNTVAALFDRLGPNEQEPPVVTIVAPADGAIVPPGFTVEVDATDNYQVARVDLYVDGQLVASDVLPPWALTAPPSVLPGPHQVEARALDKSSNVGTAAIAITMNAGCATDTDCGALEVCADGVCAGDVGAPCQMHVDCATGLCAVDGLERFCSRSCDPAAENACPEGFVCKRSRGGQPKCWPSEGGGGCAAGGVALGREAPVGAVWILLAVFGLVARRKRAG